MGRRVSIPVRVIRPADYDTAAPEEGSVVQAAGQGMAPKTVAGPRPGEAEQGMAMAERERSTKASLPAAEEDLRHELDEWRDRAIRLQADMDNYRKRQQRLAEERIATERERLLASFLGVVDDLERALSAPAAGGEGLRRGVELTHRVAMSVLEKEGVELVEAQGQSFDPNWHEAVATVARNGMDASPNRVIEVVQTGYRLGDHLLRPARVVVAV